MLISGSLEAPKPLGPSQTEGLENGKETRAAPSLLQLLGKFFWLSCCWGWVRAPEAPIWDCSPGLSIAGTNSQAVPMVEVALENDLVRCPCFVPVHCHAGRAPASAET